MSFHDHYTRSSKKMLFEEAIAKLQNELSSQISSLTNEVRSTKGEVINLKDILLLRDCKKKIISCVHNVLS